MWVLRLIAIGGLLIAGISLWYGSHRNGVEWFIIAGIMGTLDAYLRSEQRAARRFLDWLVSHREALGNGPALYEGGRVSSTTPVRRFSVCISLLVVSIKAPSRYLVPGRDTPWLTGCLYSLISVCLGWWGFPWGPIYTVQALVTNLRGGERKTVGQLLEQLRTASAGADVQVIRGCG